MRRPSPPGTSPKTYSGLSTGTHVFQVRAKTPAGYVDPSPATRTFQFQACLIRIKIGPLDICL